MRHTDYEERHKERSAKEGGCETGSGMQMGGHGGSRDSDSEELDCGLNVTLSPELGLRTLKHCWREHWRTCAKGSVK